MQLLAKLHNNTELLCVKAFATNWNYTLQTVSELSGHCEINWVLLKFLYGIGFCDCFAN